MGALLHDFEYLDEMYCLCRAYSFNSLFIGNDGHGIALCMVHGCCGSSSWSSSSVLLLAPFFHATCVVVEDLSTKEFIVHVLSLFPLFSAITDFPPNISRHPPPPAAVWLPHLAPHRTTPTHPNHNTTTTINNRPQPSIHRPRRQWSRIILC